MKTLVTALSLLLLGTAPAIAKTWRVDSNLSHEANFRTLSEATNGASAGDTLYLAGATVDYGSASINKRLYIFGPGYFLDENPMTQALTLQAKITGLSFSGSSEGSVVSGLTILGQVNVARDDISLIRNSIQTNAGNGSLLLISADADRTLIKQNYILYTPGSTRAIHLSGVNDTIVIVNNFIERPDAGTNDYAIDMSSSATALIYNNVILGDIRLNNSTVQNNILRSGAFTGSNNTVQHNIANADQFGSADGNQENVDMNTVFVGPTGNSTDGQWQILDPGPAAGAGVSGEDVGMFGGVGPYVLSGLPAIPAIYAFTAAGAGNTSQGLPVQISVKSNN